MSLVVSYIHLLIGLSVFFIKEGDRWIEHDKVVQVFGLYLIHLLAVRVGRLLVLLEMKLGRSS